MDRVCERSNELVARASDGDGSEGESGKWRRCDSVAVKKNACGRTGVMDDLLATLHVRT